MNKFFVADPVHIHKKNFKSLFDFFDENSCSVQFCEHESDFFSCYGDYRSYRKKLKKYRTKIKNIKKESLFEYKYKSHNVFDIVRSELLSFTIPAFKQYDIDIENDNKKIFDLMIRYKLSTDSLIYNYAAAMYWVDYWSDLFEGGSYRPNVVLLFSGSLTYARCLMEVLRVSTVKLYLLEHSFTGNEYYCENKLSPLPNSSKIKDINFYNNLINKSKVDFERKQIKSINKLRLKKNKNVQQPLPVNSSIHDGSKAISVLIVCQVTNDFSILGSNMKNLSTIRVYSELIRRFLAIDVNVIVKTHPWENQKSNINENLTYRILSSRFDLANVFFFENYNLVSLIKSADYVVTLSSQSGIEAAYLGKKVIQMGDAFYGNKGFTYDVECVSEAVNIVKNKRNGLLSIQEYRDFNVFLVAFLEEHLVSVHKSGLIKLRNIFINEDFKSIDLVSNNQFSIISEGNAETVLEGSEEEKVLLAARSRLYRFTRLYKKFRRSPYIYMKDSKHNSLNYLAKVYKLIRQRLPEK